MRLHLHPPVGSPFLLLTGALILAVASPGAHAVNTGFLPGDACFASRLNQQQVESMEAGNDVSFSYRRGKGYFTGCGYAGYWNLVVRDMSDDMRQRLAAVYRYMRENFESAEFRLSENDEGGIDRHETNPLVTVIYNKDYDVDLGIGLKLNENWMKLVNYRKKTESNSGAYEPWCTHYQVVARDWKTGPSVPGLQINETDARPWWGPRLDEPITVQSDRIQILILSEPINDAFALGRNFTVAEFESRRESPERFFFRITEEKTSLCYWNDKSELVEEAWPASERMNAIREDLEMVEELLESLNENSIIREFLSSEPSEALLKEMDALPEQYLELEERYEAIRDLLKEAAAAESASTAKESEHTEH